MSSPSLGLGDVDHHLQLAASEGMHPCLGCADKTAVIAECTKCDCHHPPRPAPLLLHHNHLHHPHHPHGQQQQQQPQLQHLVVAPKKPPPACGCHHVVVAADGAPPEIHEASIVQNRKLDADDAIEVSPRPPALPPRPPPRPRIEGYPDMAARTARREARSSGLNGGIRKYVFWCTACGGLATTLGALFLTVYFMLRSYTSTLGYFESIPTFVPATMLIFTGLCVMSLARRKNRHSFFIKICGICCLVCALTCVHVTISTTVVHMNRLQTLRECVYTQKSRTCTCYSVLIAEKKESDESVRFVFDSTPDCEVIHGALYTCLRAMFGLSVSGILICIFSCMLVYQLLSHERKKMYWEQLELRCRSLYQQPGNTSTMPQGTARVSTLAPSSYCSCCEECRYPPVPPPQHIFPWETHQVFDRFWTPGRVGNFYSPNPGEEGMAGGDNRERPTSGWNWRRLPWTRGGQSAQSEGPRDGLSYRAGADSQYGFGGRQEAMEGSAGAYSALENRPIGGVYVWGPPPPYSNPNSPARRHIPSPVRYHHIHTHHHHHPHSNLCHMNDEQQQQQLQQMVDCPSRRARPQVASKDNYENTAETEAVHVPSADVVNTDGQASNTLPVRKTKKRPDVSSVKSAVVNANYRTNVQAVFNQQHQEPSPAAPEEHSYHEPDLPPETRSKGVENAGFQKQEVVQRQHHPEATESEVYFADVSSCCNGQDSCLYDESRQKHKLRPCIHKQTGSNDSSDTTSSTKSKNYHPNALATSPTIAEDEDYISQRLGQRQMSTRSRLPFPLPNSDELIKELDAESAIQRIPNDISQNSLCSIQSPITESTEVMSALSSAFPSTECCLNYYQEAAAVANNSESEMSRSYLDQSYLAPDAQYEIIQQQAHNACPSFSNLTNTISGLSGFDQQAQQSSKYGSSQSTRTNISSNISALIQNLGASPVGLLYGEVNCADEETQAQACHSDGTIDSGWQSGSDKTDPRAENGQRPVNV